MKIEFSKEFMDRLKKLKRGERKYIEAIVDSIIENPECGKPLQHSLKGLRSCRHGDMRIIYRFERDALFFITFGHRKKIYRDLKR